MKYIALFLILISWLTPNHYYPWSSAWNDFLAICGLLLFLCKDFSVKKIYLCSRSIFFIIFIMLCSASVQIVFGKIKYFGDWIMVALYLLIFGLAILKGSDFNNKEIEDLQITIIWGALLSVGVALVQWTDALKIGIYVVDLPPRERPFGNLAQPNNLCTLVFMGFCALIWGHQKNLIGKYPLYISGFFLLSGMILTQSRTGLIQISFLTTIGFIFCKQANLKIGPLTWGAIWVAFLLLSLIFPYANEFLLLNSERSFESFSKMGSRLPFWETMIDAIGRELHLGYGWLQVSEAQQKVALDYKPIGEMFEHTHNIALDIIIWNGIWIGGIILFLCSNWIFKQKKILNDPSILLILMSISGLFIHAMLEFPLEYAYFLIPFGFLVGFVDKFSIINCTNEKKKAVTIEGSYVKSIHVIITVIFLMISIEYFKIENYYKVMRLESANIGSLGLETKPPKIYLLTQLKDYLNFVHSEAKINMTENELMNMKRVSERFPFPPVLFRVALAYGINGYLEYSESRLLLICKIHSYNRCKEAHDGWEIMKKKYPKLEGVNF